MLRNLLTVGGWTMLSRLLGLVRDQLLAMFLGAGAVQDAYQIAFRLPNMFRRLFGEGALNAAFVPLFTARYEEQGRKQALLLAGQAFSLLLLWLTFLTLLAEIFMPWVINLIAPGFRHSGAERFTLAVQLTRITMPYTVLICGAALVAGILNARSHFAAASAAYISFNIVGIAAILIGAYCGQHSVAPASAWGITLSGIVQLAGLLWAAKRAGVMPPLVRPTLSADIKRLLRRMMPGLIGSGVTQINLTIDTIIATLLPTGSISWLYFADRVNQLPLGVLGAALGTTLLPLFTRHITANDRPALQASLNRALDYALLLSLPAMIGLFSLAPEIMATLFGYGHFTPRDVHNSAAALRMYALGLPAFIIVKLLAPAFFAEGDTTTPVRIGFVTLGLNLALNLLLYRTLAHLAPPLASTLAALVNMLALGWMLWRRDSFRPTMTSLTRAGRILGAGVLMGLWAWGGAALFTPNLPNWHALPKLGMLMLLISSSAALYGGLLLLLGVLNLTELRARLLQRLKR
ncbi:murein biosynthesis integral membrane protein MurJ [Bombella sp. ESL0378]|uniref:murein biosynthesis integral membrane protein MurJ n=1 Tax=unclassified Bombella TaxID=2644098 RepID=UPI0012D88075|nr:MULTISPECIES: murein biosynthesis integral membrane protein MurJ [unclassified Bombella]MUG04483.1 murein biosynthesis integral membrane protein MurJ [Bombella sp. ESL0378]MUG89978.1 murein biosynthesis integral membrane protein MurJ [Bombella sp. ESL0385]